MRAGLRRFIAHHGKNGYHVTITEFWLERVEKLVAEQRDAEKGLVPLVNSVVERCSDKNLIYEFYSSERIASAEAKVGVDRTGHQIAELIVRTRGINV